MTIRDIQRAGLGVRMPHVPALLNDPLEGVWLELLLDNWLYQGRMPQKMLSALTEKYSLTAHGVGLSLGSQKPLDFEYLALVKKTLANCNVVAYSEHLSFSWVQSSIAGPNFIPDLLPLPYSQEALEYLVTRVDQVQDFLDRQILIENISAYVEFKESAISEGEFLSELATRTCCGLLLDLNNLYVNQVNLGRDAMEVIRTIPAPYIQEIHLAGFEQQESFLVDAHNNPVVDDVWSLYQKVLENTGPIATLIEWDNDLPELEVLLAEVDKAQSFIDQQRVAA